MAISIDYSVYPYIINIPKADMVQIQASPEIRQLDMDVFRLTLKDLEDDQNPGIVFPKTHDHNPSVTVSGAILARVVEINSTDYVVEFEDGAYRVNVVGANTNIGEVAVVNNVSVSTSNSAGLQDLNSLQAASFNGEVAIDPGSPFTGTVFPVGTRSFPVNNLSDAHDIAHDRGLPRLALLATITFSDTDISDGFVIVGDSFAVTLTLASATEVGNCEFRHITIEGVMDLNNTFWDCHVLDITMLAGAIHNCSLLGTLTLGTSVTAHIFDSWSGFAGTDPADIAIIDMNGANSNNLAVRNFSGGLKIVNSGSAASDSSIDMLAGRVVFDSTVTAGTFVVRGIAEVTDNSTGSAVIVDATISKEARTARKMLTNRQEVSAGLSGNLVTYEDDGVTVLNTADVTGPADEAITISSGSPAKRGNAT